ncbi:MAG TPA: nitroreductase/quinone reductase family protein [Acidimicrobiales bacterium]|nr:nitroreductase/quinone reductase family protein [Acidimicrobiales bacterium]
MGDKSIEAGAWMLEHGHRALLTLSGGRFPKKVAGMQPVELCTIGRKTGQRRATMLTSPIYGEDRVVLVASKGGHSDDPVWYKNLVANPDVEITVGDRTRKMRARTATPDEKATLWPELVKVYKGYDSYQRNTTRDIPVVICEPPPAA